MYLFAVFFFFFLWRYNWNALKAGLALFIFIPVSLNDGLNAADIRNINPQGLKDYIKTGFTCKSNKYNDVYF